MKTMKMTMAMAMVRPKRIQAVNPAEMTMKRCMKIGTGLAVVWIRRRGKSLMMLD
jgi:hypothetical protein